LFKGYLKLDGKTGTEYEWHSKSVIEYDTKHEWKRYDSKLGWKEYDTMFVKTPTLSKTFILYTQ
jgi:hypothetical protein